MIMSLPVNLHKMSIVVKENLTIITLISYQNTSNTTSPCHLPPTQTFPSFSPPSPRLPLPLSFSSPPPRTATWAISDLQAPGRDCPAPCIAWPPRAGTGWAGRPSSGGRKMVWRGALGGWNVTAVCDGWRTEAAGFCSWASAVLRWDGYCRETRR